MKTLALFFALAVAACAAESPIPAENHRALVSALQAQRDENANKVASFAAQLDLAIQQLKAKDAEIAELKKKLVEKEKPAITSIGNPESLKLTAKPEAPKK